MSIWKTKPPEMLYDAVEKTGLKKNLTALDLAALGIGCTVGVGIFVVTGVAASQYAGPAVIISFIIGALTAAFCGLTYAELAAMFPVAGSTYSYSYVAFGEIIAWIIGWDLMLEYLVAAGAVASGWSAYFVELMKNLGITLPQSLTAVPMKGGIMDLPAILVTLFITWILYIGVKESARTNNIMVAIKLGVIVLFIILGLPHINSANWVPFAPFGWKGIMTGAAVIFFAFVGFDGVSTAAEETRNPQRDVPLGLIICLIVVIILYLSVAAILTGMVSYKELDTAAPIAYALSKVGINWGSALVSVGAIVGIISTLLVTVYGQIRIFMVMARDGLLPPVFASIHPKYRTPHICTVITGIATALLAGVLPIDILAELCNIGTLFAFILVSIGVIVLRKTQPNIERKFRLPGVPFTPLITVAFCFYLMYSLPLATWIRFGVWLLAGLIIYFAYSKNHSVLQKASGKA